MADFCVQCATDIFGDDPETHKDLAGLSTPMDSARHVFARVLCEGCGPTVVDHTGRCQSLHCLEKHGLTR